MADIYGEELEMSIYVTRPSMPPLEEYIEEIRPIFESHMLTNMGPVYKKMRQQLAEYLGVKELSLFANGHMALEMAIDALGLREKGLCKPGKKDACGFYKNGAVGEVITTPFTFVSTTHAITRNGLKPVFCDIKPDGYTVDPDKIEELITERTVAIIPVHVYGQICDVGKIGEIARKHNLMVIYDAAHAFGVKYKGIGVGNFGDASMFSFHATKVFNTIEGGAVAFSGAQYKEKLLELKNFGIHGSEDVSGIGGNAKLDEFRAAMGICNLRRMDVCIEGRRQVFERYNQHLSGVDGIRLLGKQEDVTPNYAYYPVYFDKRIFGKSRDEIAAKLREEGIYARKYFYPAVNEMSCYRNADGVGPNCGGNETPVAHDVAVNILTLPIYEGLPLEDVDKICEIILKE